MAKSAIYWSFWTPQVTKHQRRYKQRRVTEVAQTGDMEREGLVGSSAKVHLSDSLLKKVRTVIV